MSGILSRFFNLFFGLFLYALGIVMSINANVGYAPWEAFHVGLGAVTGMTIGEASMVVGLIILIAVTLLGEKFGIATVLNIFFIGIFIDLITVSGIIPVMENFALGLVMLIVSLFVISFASFFYMRSAFGAGPRDNLMVVLARKTKKPVGLCRGIVELLAALGGWLLGGMVGIGTIVSFFAIGVCIQIVFTVLKFDPTAIKHESIKDTLVNLRAGKARAEENRR